MSTIVGTPEQCEALASGYDLRAEQHAKDAERSLDLAAECRADAARWRAKAEGLRARPAESTVVPAEPPSPAGVATVDSAGSAATEEP